MEEKYPKVAKGLNYFAEVWSEAFPDPDKKMRDRRAQRIKLAKIQREEDEKLEKMSPEEIEAMEASIPEWKKGALVTTDEAVVEEKKGVFGKLKSKINETEGAKKFYESDEG